MDFFHTNYYMYNKNSGVNLGQVEYFKRYIFIGWSTDSQWTMIFIDIHIKFPLQIELWIQNTSATDL